MEKRNKLQLNIKTFESKGGGGGVDDRISALSFSVHKPQIRRLE